MPVGKVHVKLASIKTAPALSPNGERAFHARFSIRSAEGQYLSSQEGSAMGHEFLDRCGYLIAKGGIELELPASFFGLQQGIWKERVVNRALDCVGSELA